MKEFLVQFLTYNDEANRRFIDAIRLVRPEAERAVVITCFLFIAAS